MLTENIVPVFPCRDKANDGDLAGNVLRQSEAGFTSCGVAVKAEEHFSGVLAFRKETVKGFARNAAQGKIISCLPILRIKADKRQKVYDHGVIQRDFFLCLSASSWVSNSFCLFDQLFLDVF